MQLLIYYTCLYEIYAIKMTYMFYRKVFHCGFTILLMRNNDLTSAVQPEKAFCHLFTIVFVTVLVVRNSWKKSHPLTLGA